MRPNRYLKYGHSLKKWNWQCFARESLNDKSLSTSDEKEICICYLMLKNMVALIKETAFGSIWGHKIGHLLC